MTSLIITNYTVAQTQDGSWLVTGHGIYGASSPLAGQRGINHRGFFASLEDALEAYPDAQKTTHPPRHPAIGWPVARGVGGISI